MSARPTWLSVLQFFVKESETDVFENDLEEMHQLARKQPGYIWGHYSRSLVDGRYFVISEWESYVDMKKWEHQPRHEEIGETNESRYVARRDMQNRKFIPWYKPGAERKSWTG